MSRFMRKVRAIEAELGIEKEGMTKEQLNLEKSLKGWLNERSTVDIFDWFDCIETTVVETEAGKFRWSTESVKRDKLFLERLGMKVVQ